MSIELIEQEYNFHQVQQNIIDNEENNVRNGFLSNESQFKQQLFNYEANIFSTDIYLISIEYTDTNTAAPVHSNTTHPRVMSEIIYYAITAICHARR